MDNTYIVDIEGKIKELKRKNTNLIRQREKLKRNTDSLRISKIDTELSTNNTEINKLKDELNELTSSKKYIKSPIKFDKILMYGFVRNDMGYRLNDTTFLDGTIKTFDFLKTLQQVKGDEHTEKSSGGTLIGSPARTEETTNLLKNIFLQKAGKLAEAGYKAAFVEPYNNSNKVPSTIGGGGTTELIKDRSYKLHPSSLSQEGGGIIDKNVVDSDRALLIAVTFVISVVVMHVKKVLYSKQFVQNRNQMLYVMLALFFFMMMLFKVVVSMQTIDTMYMLLYLIMFSIVNVSVNIFQMDVNTSRSLNKAVHNIEDELNVSMTLPIEHVDEDILRENKYDSNMLLTWAITSVGVIFV
jgi:hypothetical protein